MKSPIQELLVAGTFRAARAEAFMMKSFTEILVLEDLFNAALSLRRLSMATWTVT